MSQGLWIVLYDQLPENSKHWAFYMSDDIETGKNGMLLHVAGNTSNKFFQETPSDVSTLSQRFHDFVFLGRYNNSDIDKVKNIIRNNAVYDAAHPNCQDWCINSCNYLVDNGLLDINQVNKIKNLMDPK